MIIYRNEKYEKEMDTIHLLITTGKHIEAKNACENLLKGELKHRCENAEFWITYASIEKVWILLNHQCLDYLNNRFGN